MATSTVFEHDPVWSQVFHVPPGAMMIRLSTICQPPCEAANLTLISQQEKLQVQLTVQAICIEAFHKQL